MKKSFLKGAVCMYIVAFGLALSISFPASASTVRYEWTTITGHGGLSGWIDVDVTTGDNSNFNAQKMVAFEFNFPTPEDVTYVTADLFGPTSPEDSTPVFEGLISATNGIIQLLEQVLPAPRSNTFIANQQCQLPSLLACEGIFGAGIATNSIDRVGMDPSQQTSTGRWKIAAVPAVPVPAAVWLFGSGLLGLIGVARRKKA
jgi:hypothetical protein